MAKPNKGSGAAESLLQPWKPAEKGERRGAASQGRATFHLPGALLNEMRNAVVALSGPPYRLTMSKLAESAIRRELERLRREAGRAANKGFTQRAGEVTRGRPIR